MSEVLFAVCPDEFRLIVSRGYLRPVRERLGEPEPASVRRQRRLRALGSQRVPRTAGRGDLGQTSRSRNNVRRLFASLPWELLGPWPAMITLTYPGDWQEWVRDGREWTAQSLAAFWLT